MIHFSLLTCSLYFSLPAAKSSVVLESQLPAVMAGGTDKIQDLEDSLHRERSQISLEIQKEPPKFTKPLENLDKIREGETARFEATLIPTDDSELKVEWFKNGKSMRAGNRMRTIHDFGVV